MRRCDTAAASRRVDDRAFRRSATLVPIRMTTAPSTQTMNITNWSKTDTRWYLGVECCSCNAPILFSVDRTDGTAEVTPPTKLVLTCSRTECRVRSDYSAAKVTRFQKRA